jgi:hypothetical protein
MDMAPGPLLNVQRVVPGGALVGVDEPVRRSRFGRAGALHHARLASRRGRALWG